MPTRLDLRDPDFEVAFEALVLAKRAAESDVDGVVADIVERIRLEGDAALIELTARLDGFEAGAETLRVPTDEIEAASRDADADTVAALEFAARRIADYHQRQMPEDLDYVDAQGVRLGHRWTAIAAVGIYVPGGTAAYPSSVLMNAVPAKVAGVPRVAMCVPASGGQVAPLVLAAAHIAGIDEIYRIGGAQAVAALAHGTETIAAVDKVVGPGNAYVAAAKRRLFGTIGIDLIAGPSEILVLADGANDARWIAADLLSQAEHDPTSQSIVITDDAGFADAVTAAVDEILKDLPRADIAGESWRRFGGVITVENLSQAVSLIDRIAPEHLELAIADPDAIAGQVRNAGAIFLGRHVPEALGDYVAGPNHVLPTAGAARFSSGLGVLDFMKRTSLIGGGADALAALAPAAEILARAEGLDAHALSLAVRCGKDGS
jgi:histidinol dehydrogenase